MKIERFTPKPISLPSGVTMKFTEDEGWDVLMALNDAVAKYPDAASRGQWRKWAMSLEELLRRG